MKLTIEYVRANILMHKAAKRVVATSYSNQAIIGHYHQCSDEVDSAAIAIFNAAAQAPARAALLSDLQLILELPKFREDISFIAVSEERFVQERAENSHPEILIEEFSNSLPDSLESLRLKLNMYLSVRDEGLVQLGDCEPFMRALNEQDPDLAQEFRRMCKEFSDLPCWRDFDDKKKISLLNLGDLGLDSQMAIQILEQSEREDRAVLQQRITENHFPQN